MQFLWSEFASDKVAVHLVGRTQENSKAEFRQQCPFLSIV
jgi:hypothetical protein